MAALVLALAVLPAGQTLAQAERTTWSVRPADTDHGTGRPNFSYTLEPGQAIEDAIVVSNHSPAPLTLRVYAADGFTTPDGLLDLLPAGQPSIGIGTWITVARDQVTIPPGEQIEIPFTLVVPTNARPGDHSGGIVTSLRRQDTASGLTQDSRLGSRIHARIEGNMHAAVDPTDVTVRHHRPLNPFAPGRITVDYTLTGTGNLRATGIAAVHIEPVLGLDRHTVTDGFPEIVVGGELQREVVLEGVWPLVRRTVTVTVHPHGAGIGAAAATIGAPSSVTVTIWTIPWTLLACLAAAIAAGITIGSRRRR